MTLYELDIFPYTNTLPFLLIGINIEKRGYHFMAITLWPTPLWSGLEYLDLSLSQLALVRAFIIYRLGLFDNWLTKSVQFCHQYSTFKDTNVLLRLK